MADIIRGASKASETLGAQKIKAQYASMRIQERQKAVAQYASAVFDIQVQLMRKHMGPEEIAKLAQVQFMGEDPQMIQQAFQLIKSPEFILRARIESDTLSDIDFQAEKQDRMEYMQTITNYLKETMQTIQQDPLMGPFLMQLLQFSLAGFKIGKKFEGELDRTFGQIQQKLSQPQQPQPNPDQQKAQAEIQLMQQKGQMDQQAKQMELQFKAQENQLKLVGKQKEAQVDAAIQAQRMRQSQIQFAHQMEQERMRAQQQAVQEYIKGPGGGNGAA
jgi:hypothetical protein